MVSHVLRLPVGTLIAAAAFAGSGLVAARAQEQPVTGLYLGAGLGANFMQSNSVELNIFRPTGGLLSTTAGTTNAYFSPGFAGLASVGWGFGNGLRTELEVSYRTNSLNSVSGIFASPTIREGGSEQKLGTMVNVLYDFYGTVPWVTPYLGVGIGYQWAKWDGVNVADARGDSFRVDDTQGRFAYQAILGAAWPLPTVPGLAITAEYRFMGMTGHRDYPATFVAAGGATSSQTIQSGADYNHALLLGVRYAFNTPSPPPPPAAPMPVAAPAPAPARSYLVFFDWDKATLTDRARQVIQEAAENSTRVQYTRIEVNGYTDTSGTAKYNQALSVRRAEAVAGELVKDGVPRESITAQGFGDTNLLVPTGPGVREPQNRRVEIIIR